MPRHREDPREHGDRPQRHARPVGLDERSGNPLLGVGLGHRVHRQLVEALPQLRAPHVYEHSRQGQGSRLRDHAYRSTSEVEPRLPGPAVLQRAADGVLRVGRRPARSRHRGYPSRREARQGARRGPQGHRRQGTEAVRQGLRGLAADQCRGIRAGAARLGWSSTREQEVSPRVQAAGIRAFRQEPPDGRPVGQSGQWCREHVPLDGGRQLHRQHHSQCLVERDHLLRSLPGPGLHLQPGRGRERDPRRMVRPSVGRSREHRRRTSVPPDERQPELPGGTPPVPGYAQHAVLGRRAEDQGHLRALRVALQHRTVLPAMGHGPADHRKAGVPGRQGSAEAGPLPSRGELAS